MDSWALLSVSDKTGLVELARHLRDEQGLKLLATASTARHLMDNGFEVATVESLTGFGEILDGRVKTLHPLIYGGLLASSKLDHQAQRETMGAPDIRVVVVNLYPFERRWQEGLTGAELIEEIDIGGVSLIRAAAKNNERVAVLVDPGQYEPYMDGLHDEAARRRLAVEAFRHVAYYDAIIAEALSEPGEQPDLLALAGRRQGTLRYGENPHQTGAFYAFAPRVGFADAQLLQGKALSFNNYADADTAVKLARDLSGPAAVVVKHQTPSSTAFGETILDAYQRAHDADPVSIFGGVVAVNRPVDRALAAKLTEIFLEVVVAPAVEPDAAAILAKKKNLRVLVMSFEPHPSLDFKGILGGVLVQPADAIQKPLGAWRHVAGPAADLEALSRDLDLAWKTVARVKSNAIVVVKDGVTLGIGGGQTNRIDAARQALDRAGDKARGAIVASDGFFPFGDVLKLCGERGVAVVVEPGGSLRDQESIDEANEAGITLIMTDERHFRH
ncbi:bifunctional phosphoribosylaminoimidazolecarboxamide formyltransferase/IMP cyclohydrolase [Sulfobacillus harzensis]|uniref:Bifunctional purine biosynthesis protein PurH n=1 Tax=Sulfobacillus harzensis TaxID=2729629 RepID=A0A7Y0Q352_9FIRM|nr:bifunctional phosphoribosylaminoimidazolecarboxamide formyltransferase/IMP cyclohydrolase [Sulfobacillus harzensis]NMP22606.1 bifunctional phosphoribosylaminoimidazolecarboxamide formyltransferase/IMP cyclohydrolase [Sulfobacillus harzensis]